MLSFKEKREVQKQIKAQYEALVDAKFSEKRAIQKQLKELYSQLKEKPAEATDTKAMINQAMMWLDQVKDLDFNDISSFDKAREKISGVFDKVDAEVGRNSRVTNKHEQIRIFVDSMARKYVSGAVLKALESKSLDTMNKASEDLSNTFGEHHWFDEDTKVLDEKIIDLEAEPKKLDPNKFLIQDVTGNSVLVKYNSGDADEFSMQEIKEAYKNVDIEDFKDNHIPHLDASERFELLQEIYGVTDELPTMTVSEALSKVTADTYATEIFIDRETRKTVKMVLTYDSDLIIEADGKRVAFFEDLEIEDSADFETIVEEIEAELSKGKKIVNGFVAEDLFKPLKPFLPYSQKAVIEDALRGEEKEFFAKKLEEIAKTIEKMPKTYETDGQGDDAVVYLHYFNAGSDWYITEKDQENQQLQAFGYVVLNGDKQNAKLGYVNIDQLIELRGVELDLYWRPVTLGKIKGTEKPDSNSEKTEKMNRLSLLKRGYGYYSSEMTKDEWKAEIKETKAWLEASMGREAEQEPEVPAEGLSPEQKGRLENNEKWVEFKDKNYGKTYYMTHNSDTGYILLNSSLQRLDKGDYASEFLEGHKLLTEGKDDSNKTVSRAKEILSAEKPTKIDLDFFNEDTIKEIETLIASGDAGAIELDKMLDTLLSKYEAQMDAVEKSIKELADERGLEVKELTVYRGSEELFVGENEGEVKDFLYTKPREGDETLFDHISDELNEDELNLFAKFKHFIGMQ